MKTTIGYLINTIRMNAIITFAIMQCICLYFTVMRPDNVSGVLRALLYASALDSFVSCAIVIGLKNRKGV